jgi:2'-5' RNA ligase/GNAT superfamily N-acetyltransferase
MTESPHLAGSPDVAPVSSSNASPTHALAAHGDPFAEGQGFHVAQQMIAHDGWTVKSDVPSEPPNYRPAAKRLNAPHCGSCKMYENGKCWGYGNKPVEEDAVCDSYSASSHKSAVDDWHSPEEGSTYDEGHPLGELAARHPNVDLFATEKPQGLRLKMIQVGAQHQREGYAGAALRDLLSYADERGKPVALNPGDVEGRPGMSNPQLRRWYGEHGFVPNKGRNKDYTFSEAMIRQPQPYTDNSLQEQGDNLPNGNLEVDRPTSSFAGDSDWKLPVFVKNQSLSTCARGDREWARVVAAEKDELFIALNVPKPTADEIHAWAKEQDWPEGTELEEPTEYHITLLYSPKGHEEHKEAEWWTTDNSDSVHIDGLEAFPSQEREELEAFVLRVDTSDGEIKTRMDKLLDAAEDEGVEVNRYPGGSKPHITVAYGPKLPKGIKPPEITFSTDEAHCGKPRTSKLADYNVQVPVVTPNQGVGLATPHQVGDLLSLQSVAHNLHYKYQQSGLDPNSAQQYASKLLQAIGYTSPDQPTIDAALQAWKAMYPEDARSAYALPGVATSSHDADGGFGDAALHWTDAHTASASDGERESLALLEFSGLSGRDSDAAANAKHDGSLSHGWTVAHTAASPQTIISPIRAIVDQGGQVHTFNDGHAPYSTSNGIDPATNQAHLQIHQPSGEIEDLSGAHSPYEEQVANHLNTQTGEDRYHARPNDMDWVFGSAGGAPQKSQTGHQPRIAEDMHVHEPKLPKLLSFPSRRSPAQVRARAASTSARESQGAGGSPSLELSSFLSHIHEADSWDTRQWPDPLSDNGTGGNVPRGCTCQSGHKLDCPVHGLEANGEYDTMEWTIPEASPVGYPQDQPRNWQQASSVATSPAIRHDVHQDDEAKTDSQANEHRAKQRTNNGTEGNEYEWHQVHAPSIADTTSQGASHTALAHMQEDVKCRPSYKALLRPSGLRQSIEIVGSDNDLEWYSSPYSSYDLSQKTSGPISDGTGTPDVTVEEVDAPAPLATDDPWNENFRNRRPLLYHVPTGKVLMGPSGSEHGSLYNHLEHTTPEWLPEEVHEGIIGKGGVKFFDDNSSNPEGYPQAAADAVVHHTGVPEDPEVDKEYGWDFNGSHRAAALINVPGNEDFDFQGRVPLIAHGENVYAGTNGETHDSLKSRLGEQLQGVHPNDLAHGGMYVDSHASEYGIAPGSYEWFDTNFAQPGSLHNQAVEDEIRKRGLEPRNLDDGFTFSKIAAVPVQYHGDINPSEPYPGWEDGDMFGEPIGYADRWPTVVHNGTVHIGPEQSTHGQIRQKLGLPATGDEPEGWIGRNPEAEEDEHDVENIEFLPGEPEDGEGAPYGWYGRKGEGSIPHQNTGITESMMNYWNTFLRHKEPTPGTGYGHGPRMSGVSVHEIGSPSAVGDEWHGDRRPFFYHPDTHEILLGPMRAEHSAMINSPEGRKYRPWLSHDELGQGGVYTNGEGQRVVEFYTGTPDKDRVQEVTNALGANKAQLNEWHVGDEVHDQPDMSWDFNSKVAMPVSDDFWQAYPHDLYHGTTEDRLPSIMQNGLQPWDSEYAGGSRYEDGNVPWLMPRPEHVYLSPDPARAHQRARDASDPGQRVVVLKVDPRTLNPANINPDEDDMHRYVPGAPSAFGDSREIQRQLGDKSLGEYAEQHGWGEPEDTERILGDENSVAHRGPIPPQAITPGTYDVDMNEPPPRSYQWRPTQQPVTAAQEGPTGDELRDIEDSQPQERQGLIPLSWEPGLHGKGLYFPQTDKLTTWSDPRHHSDVWYDDEHYPEPGVAHHLDIQPNGQYVDQGAFNREMENNNEGLDEGELAQAIQRQEPRLTDRDPGHEWSFSKVAHQLGWQPGEHGKGLVHNGEVHTWGVGDNPDGQPTHPEYAQQNFDMNEGQYANHQMFDSAFQVDPKGNVNIYEDHPDTMSQVAQAVESADPRLKANVLHDYNWDFGNVEPTKTEPDMDEHGNMHGVQFTNDSPGVATVDA